MVTPPTRLFTVLGIIMIKDSHPFIKLNRIYKNEGIGLYIRDKCGGTLELNYVVIPLSNISIL